MASFSASIPLPSRQLTFTAGASSSIAWPRRPGRSFLFSTTMRGLPANSSRWHWSSGVSGTDVSITCNTRSAWPSDSRLRRMPSRSIVSLDSCRPAVSMNWTAIPRICASSEMVSRVVPATSETIARSRPSSWLSRLDLPALGRPTMATRMPRRISCPSLAVASSSSIKRQASSSRFPKPSTVSGSISSSGKSMCASMWASTCIRSSRNVLMRCDSLPASCSLAALNARSVRA